ncbi:MAG: DEAD/DEAH box helicase [Zhaonellaceae bacterium]
MSFSPVTASKKIVDKYKRYLHTIFEIADKKYSEQFIAELSNERSLAAGPYLGITDSFIKGRSIHDLINDGVLPKEFEKIKMPMTRPLYKHQEIAIEKVGQGKNIVVSTGTGSGKTESFLIPIFRYLIKQKEENTLNPGVRALIIYPMNALANDQIERLRELLINFPEITYGSYTGQTKHKYSEALAEYKELNNGQTPLKNELISREQMKDSPPNILITNYAMLEYLMLRPSDSIFFNNSDNWKYIVLDEAHVYNGSTGIEVSMLLRRLKAKLMNDGIHYILTSATLGGEDDNKEVAQFATNLCNSSFSEQDIVRAHRLKPKTDREKRELPVQFYQEIASLLDNGNDEMKVADAIRRKINSNDSKTLQELLYDTVIHDNNYWKIRSLLVNPMTIADLAKKMKWSEQDIANFVTVSTMCEKNGDRLFNAKYHMFLRATESVFITLNPSNKLFLTRKLDHIEQDGNSYKVFEIATCSSCHCIYIVGKEENGYLIQSNFSDVASPRYVYLLSDSVSDTDEDHTLTDEAIDAEEYELCSRCGAIHKKCTNSIDLCEHDKQYYVAVIKVKIKNKSGVLTKCLSCENTNNHGILRMFFTGQEAVTSVIGTALFEELPSYKIKQEIRIEEDDTGFGVSSPEVITHKIKEAKQYIAFSDNRQAAAFYASYLDQTYRNILYKRLIVETLSVQKYCNKNVNNFVEDLIYQFEKYDIATKDYDTTRKEAWKAILQEIVDNNGSTSLYSMGLIGLSINSEHIPGNKKYNLTAKDVGTLCSVLKLGMMSDAALLYDVNLNRADKEFFTHNGVEYCYTLSDSDRNAFRRSFIPTKVNMKNKRFDYLTRVLSRAGFDVDNARVNQLLEAIWNRILCNLRIVKPFNGTYKLDTEQIIISKNDQWYICPKCKKVTIHNVFNVCPTYKCEGTLKPIDLQQHFKNNHYYQLYQTLDIRELRVVEHTAQLDKETAYEYQKQFKNKEIDVLSCSTTFEMGVDVGTLETVFMRNMPPSPANYAQRAGRAGRSKRSAAYALTFCNKSNHDFSFFKTPEKMIRGKIDPPRFIIDNDKIAIRHVFASALSFFWKKYPEYFSNISTFAEANENSLNGFDKFNLYLNKKPKDLKLYLQRFLTDSLSKKFGIENFSWVNELIREDKDNPGALTKAIAEYDYEVGVLTQAFELAFKTGGKVDYLRERIRVYRNEDILSFLSRKNVLPKYGFPVDTVEMIIIDKSNKTKLGLQLQRDLSMAISEYAPGSQIVANGNLITSRFIRKVPNMSWKMYDYIMCECKTLNIEPHLENEELSQLKFCKQCNMPFKNKHKKTFLIPAFGFEADGDKIKKPSLKKPEKTFKSDIAYVGYKNKVEMFQFYIGNSHIELGVNHGDEMAVINESNFFVCQNCGYTVLDEKCYGLVKREKHKNPAGYWCRND